MSGAGPSALEVVEYGDCGLLVTFTHQDPEARWAAGQALQTALLADPANGVVDVVASFETAFVSLDPLRSDVDRVRTLIMKQPGSPVIIGPARDFTVPVVYGGAYGPDLDVVAAELAIDAAEVIDLHASAPWTVRLRASPGAAPMMDGSALPGSVSRHPASRTRLPPGSVGLSGRQCMVYPVESPGGWRIIGRTPVPFLDLATEGLVAYRPGDRIRFTPIEAGSWDDWSSRRLEP